MTEAKVAVARQMYDSREHTVAAIAAALDVSRASVYRSLAGHSGESSMTRKGASMTPDFASLQHRLRQVECALLDAQARLPALCRQVQAHPPKARGGRPRD